MFIGFEKVFLLLISASSVTSFLPRGKRNALDNTLSTSIPLAFDFRDYGKVTAVKNQGQCGSAWAHATIASIESQYLLRFNQSLDLSEQTLLNCEWSSDLCYSSDKTIPSFNYAKESGIPLESCAPYTSGVNGNVEIMEGCESCTSQRYKIAGFRHYGSIPTSTYPFVEYSEDKIAEDLYNFGPATVVIYLPPRNNGTHDFYDNVNHMIKNYTGGILDIPSNICNKGCMQMVVFLLVGYTPDFWIAKASFGPNWGENGYIRFKRGSNFCAMKFSVIGPFLENSLPPATTTKKPAPSPIPSTSTTTTKIPTPAPSCGTGWILREGTNLCYRYVSGKDRTQAEMEQWCVNQGKQGHLVSIHSLAEADFLEGVIPNGAGDVVIGYKNNAWTDASAMDFDNFVPNEPKNSCAAVKAPTFQWKSIDCNAKFQEFVCRRNA